MTAVRTFLVASAATTLFASGILLSGATAHAEDAVPANDGPVSVVDEGTRADTGAGTDSTAPAAAEVDSSDVADGISAPKAQSTKGIAPRAATVFGTLKVSPAGPYTDGQSVKLTYTGFPANSQIVASTCIGGIKLGGPGDCAPLNGPASAISAADADGGGSVTIKVVKGVLGATDKPSAKCSNKASEPCVFSLTDFSGNGPATIKVVYKEAAAKAPAAGDGVDDSDGGAARGSNGSEDDSSENDGASGDGTSDGAATGKGSETGVGLAATGAGPASSAALAGYTLLVLGIGLLLVARRTSPEPRG